MNIIAENARAFMNCAAPIDNRTFVNALIPKRQSQFEGSAASRRRRQHCINLSVSFGRLNTVTIWARVGDLNSWVRLHSLKSSLIF